jgi:hypothetical protein
MNHGCHLFDGRSAIVPTQESESISDGLWKGHSKLPSFSLRGIFPEELRDAGSFDSG